MRNLHLRAQTFSQACHASGTGQINGAWPSLTKQLPPSCPGITEIAVRDLVKSLSRISEIRSLQEALMTGLFMTRSAEEFLLPHVRLPPSKPIARHFLVTA